VPSTEELGWVAESLGLRLVVERDVLGAGFDHMAGLALRRNPRRAHLLVSRLLGKHLPVEPQAALGAAGRLAAALPVEVREGRPLVFGFAETATALGHAVAAAVRGATYVSSTRRPGTSAFGFAEEHSHAVEHAVLAPRTWLTGNGAGPAALPPVVLVDDELSTGRTALNTIRALHALAPRPSWTVAALLDVRPPGAREAFDALARELGVPVRGVALMTGSLRVPDDAVARAAAVLAEADPPLSVVPVHPVVRLDGPWPSDLPLGGRRGWTPRHGAGLDAAMPPLADRVETALDALSPSSRTGQVLVLGTEELMYVPMRLAAELAVRRGPGRVRTQSTTRSPVAPLDRDGYAIRTALSFPAPDEPGRACHLYNVAPGRYDAIVVVCDPPATLDDAPLLDALATCAPVVQVRLPEEAV
jgi:hypothetical protein